MANGTPTWNGTDSCDSKLDLGNLGSNISQAMVQFLDYISISANQNTDVQTLKWYTVGGDWSLIQNSCPVLNDLPNFYQYMTRLGIQNSSLGWFYTWTELLDAVNAAGVITTILQSTMGWDEVQNTLYSEGGADWTIYSQQENCSCVGSISGGGGGIGGTINGCMNPTATNYNPLATIDDGSCIGGLTPGCCDPTATNFDPLATCDDGSCLYTGGPGNICLTCGTGGDDSVPGCCNVMAYNYNYLATCDDGSCIAILYGCMDPMAANYYSAANSPEPGGCVFLPPTWYCDQGGAGCQSTGTGNGQYATLIECQSDGCASACNPGSGDLIIRQTPGMVNANWTIDSTGTTGIDYCSDYGWMNYPNPGPFSHAVNAATCEFGDNFVYFQLTITPATGYKIKACDFGIDNVNHCWYMVTNGHIQASLQPPANWSGLAPKFGLGHPSAPAVSLPIDVQNVSMYDTDLGPIDICAATGWTNPIGGPSTIGPWQPYSHNANYVTQGQPNFGTGGPTLETPQNQVKVIVAIKAGHLFPDLTGVSGNTHILDLNITGTATLI